MSSLLKTVQIFNTTYKALHDLASDAPLISFSSAHSFVPSATTSLTSLLFWEHTEPAPPIEICICSSLCLECFSSIHIFFWLTYLLLQVSNITFQRYLSGKIIAVMGPVRELMERKGRVHSPELVWKGTKWRVGEKEIVFCYILQTNSLKLMDTYILNNYLQLEHCTLLWIW